MRDAVRIAVEAGDDEQKVRIHDDEGEVEVGDATFRFSVTSSGSDKTEYEDRYQAETESDDGDSLKDDDPRRIAAVDEVPTDGTLRCEAIDGRRGTEFILWREETTVFAWRNSCPHKPEVPLDPGGGAIVTDEHVVCHEHGARFKRGDGVCTSGPCQGKVLDEIEVDVRDGTVYLMDDRFEAGYQLTGSY
ncbi:Rieske (2Fe-2S) protein [Halorussus salinisoli]|uniref:Rieske (2Fe-2S) protein n=1 Tax=Halorussus salinisoli TaxID=2558242 RepID=UPI0010C22218|nr:Rieske 2Fe-2S domain-containing protein [Halorussus salinisoli]